MPLQCCLAVLCCSFTVTALAQEGAASTPTSNVQLFVANPLFGWFLLALLVLLVLVGGFCFYLGQRSYKRLQHFLMQWCNNSSDTLLTSDVVELLPATCVESLQELLLLGQQTNIELSRLRRYEYVLNQYAIFAVTDIRGDIVYANQKFSDISGYTFDELIGNNHRILKSGFHPPSFYRDMYVTISRGDIWRGEIKNRNKAGEYYWVDTTIIPMMQNNKPLYYFAVRVDITEKKQVIEGLKQAKQEAELAVQVKTNFLTSMSHELRTPLNSIIGYSKRLLKTLSEQLEERHIDSLATIERNGKHLLEVLDDILDVSKLEAGLEQLVLESFKLNDLVSHVMARTHAAIQDKDLYIEQSFPTGDIEFLQDEKKLRHILNILLDNAVEYTHQGGVQLRVDTMAACHLPNALDSICPARNNDIAVAVRFRVIDTGIGIAAEYQQQLFQRFNDFSANPNQRIEGSGLGLVLVTEYTALLQGYVDVHSEEGKGSEFTVIVPIVHPDSVMLDEQQQLQTIADSTGDND